MKPFDKKTVWVIKNFSSLKSSKYYSVPFLMRDATWRLIAYPEEYNGVDYLSVYLEAVGVETLPNGWRQFIEFRFTIVNQYRKNLSVTREGQNIFDKKLPNNGWPEMIPVTQLTSTDSGFLVNKELMIIVEVDDAFADIRIVDSEPTTFEVDGFQVLDLQGKDRESKALDHAIVEVNGFQVYGSEVNQVKEIFEKHPDLTSSLDLKNQRLKNSYMVVLLDLIKILSKSVNELEEEDLNKAESTLSDLTKVGFKLDWLHHEFDEALEKHKALDKKKTCDTSYVRRLRNIFI